jgi:hypothetical protein
LRAVAPEPEHDNLPDLTTEQILAWADAHHRHTGKWPICHSGAIPEAPGETWLDIEAALYLGLRGFRGRSTLARFLAKHGRKHNRRRPPRITLQRIVTWADAFHARTGQWPIQLSGDIPESGGLNWNIVDKALREGRCGLPGGSSLACLLDAKRGVPNRLDQPHLTIKQILAWADQHHRTTGTWPTALSGPVLGSSDETWHKVDLALRRGTRGLKRGLSLPRLLAKRRRVPNKQDLPPLSINQILSWADAYHKRTRAWPRCRREPIREAPGLTWIGLDSALREGRRGLPGRVSLARLLAEKRGVRNRQRRPDLTERQILAWADAFHERTARWPNVRRGGSIPDAPGETWQAVHDALYVGLRGLPGGSSLARLLAKERGVRNIHGLPRLTLHLIIRWAKAHRRRTGEWPSRTAGPIAEAIGETWDGVYQAAYKGLRGLPAKTSIAQLMNVGTE